jgi:hypothetical protein
MSVCKYPNNVGSFKEKCPGEEKYNTCYGEDTDFPTLEKLEEHVSKIQKDALHYGKMKDIFTLGCWENKNNSPFIEDWKKLEEKDPIRCMENDNKWVTGDGYVMTKKENSTDLKRDTSDKIDVTCSPGYEGEAFIEVDGCEDYKVFKEGDPGEYEQFLLSGCNECTVKYGGNRDNKDDISCYPQCGVLGTTVFDERNSNKDLQFIDTKIEFEKGNKRAGYCCNAVKGAITQTRIKDTEKPEGSNLLRCSINKCEKEYIKNKTNDNCCKKIENSKENIEYECGKNPNTTEPSDKEINYCMDGYYPGFTEDGRYDCLKCERDENTHSDAEIKCDMNGSNVIVKKSSVMKCNPSNGSYYDETDQKCKRCPGNKELNINYDKDIDTSEICSCKPSFRNDDVCFECSGNHIEYNNNYPDINDKRCKCVVDGDLLPENVLPGDCEGVDLYEGDTCNLECAPGYKVSGRQPKCLENSFDMSDFKCVKDDSKIDDPETTMDENADTAMTEDPMTEDPMTEDPMTEDPMTQNTETLEGFKDYPKLTLKRLFLIFLLIILILNVL